jgi:hypothetical protein
MDTGFRNELMPKMHEFPPARLSVAPMMDWTDFLSKTITCKAPCALDVPVLIAEFRALA